MAQPNQTIGYRLTCSAKGVDRKDAGGLGKSDPYLVFKITNPSGKVIEVFRSEVIHNNLDPHWKAFDIEFEQVGGPNNPILVECYDYDEDGTHDFIGSFTAQLQTICNGSFSEALYNKAKKGRPFYKHSGMFKVDKVEPIPLSARKVVNGYRLTLAATGVERKDVGGGTDPFLVISGTPLPTYSRPGDPTAFQPPQQQQQQVAAKKDKKDKKDKKVKVKDGSHAAKVVLYKTEFVKKERNPTWAVFQLDVGLCGGLDSPLTIDAFDFDKDGKYDYIGSCKSTLRMLALEGMQFPLVNGDKSRPGYRNSGTLRTIKSERVSDPLPAPAMGFTFKFAATKLDRKDLKGSDPYFKIEAQAYNTTSRSVAVKSDVLKKTTEGEWKEFSLSVAQCGGYDAPLLITFWDQDNHTKDDFIGEVRTTLRELLQVQSAPLRIVNPEREASRGALYRNSGILTVVKAAVDPNVAAAQTQHFVQPGQAPQPGFPPQGYPPQGYPPQGYPPQGYPPQGYPPQGYPPQGYPPQGYPPQGYPPQGYPPQGYPPQGYPPQGYPPQGYPPQGYPPQGYPQPGPGYPPQQQQQPPKH